jgi:hypothetical protein
MDFLHFGREYKKVTFVCQGPFSEVPIVRALGRPLHNRFERPSWTFWGTHSRRRRRDLRLLGRFSARVAPDGLNRGTTC